MGLNNKSEMWERLIVSFARDKNLPQGLESFRDMIFRMEMCPSKQKLIFLEATLYFLLRLIKAVYGRYTETSNSRSATHPQFSVVRNGLYADYVES